MQTVTELYILSWKLGSSGLWERERESTSVGSLEWDGKAGCQKRRGWGPLTIMKTW